MAPTRIMMIRHAEKPSVPPDDNDGGNGVTVLGHPDKESLTVRGWQRAGALAKFFTAANMRPDIIFASAPGHDGSKRPKQTVTPLAQLLGFFDTDKFVTTHPRDDLKALIDDVMDRDGVVLISWQHERIPGLVARLPNSPAVPQDWPGSRFDIVWVLDRTGSGWSFSQTPQMLLAGDRETPIS
jgi:broad specificity phosphatase PhoE